MGPSKLWLPTLLVTCFSLLHYAVVDAQIAHTMRHWRHREKGVCSGSSNGFAIVSAIDRFNDLREIYKNCSRVFGNIEITHLKQEEIGNRTIDFLDEIEEVKGYILIYNTELKRISFKKLKVIWGDDLISDTAALQFQKNLKLKEVSMPNLRSIEKGSVLYTTVPRLCYVKNKVDFNEIVNFDQSRVMYLATNWSGSSCEEKPPVQCHPSCNGACWGPGKDDCQSIYRSHCSDKCESRQCYEDAKTNQTDCCHPQCVAGCYGPTSKDCYFCTTFSQCKEPQVECRCVDQCTSMRKYNAKTGQVEVNPDGYYSVDNRHCEKECPEHRLVQDDVCVEHCGPGMHYDPNNGDKICRKCDGACPKTCKFEEPLNSASIRQLQNCTEIEGYIALTSQAFSTHNTSEYGVIGPLTLEDLSVLRSVRFISEYLYFAVESANIKSLAFLENLEIIEGRSTFSGRQALVVSKSDNLESLGLRKLKKIQKGDVIVSKNSDLCYTDSFSWKELIKGANNTARFLQNRDPEVCKTELRTCNAACDQEYGCWGPSTADCRKCKHWLQDGRCVEKCQVRGFFQNPDKMECEPCDRDCDTCKGPAPTDCITCRGFKLYKRPGELSAELDDDDFIEDAKPVSHLLKGDGSDTTMAVETPSPSEAKPKILTCVAECDPTRFYVENGECKKCHHACYTYGCDGPFNNLGNNGCNKCRYAQVEKPTVNSSLGVLQRCLYNKDKLHTYSVCLKNDLVNHFVQVPTHAPDVEEFECAPCDEECDTCTSRGNSRLHNKCKCKNYVVLGIQYRNKGANSKEPPREDERCVPAECPRGTFFDNSTIDAAAEGVCRVCNAACEREGEGIHCTGVTDKDCGKCAKEYYSIRSKENKDQVQCVKNCSDFKLFAYHKEMSCNEADYETRDRIHKAALYILLALFIVIVLIIGFCLYRRQKRLSKELEQEKVANNPEMPELIPMDFNGPKINREKFLLISGHELSRGAKELGRGAFGVVYAGCWMPPLGNKGKPTKVPVAIKVVRDPSGKAQSEMLDEALKMTMLRHENLLRIVGVCLSGEDLQLVTLLRPLGNLREFLQKHKGKLSGKELLAYSYQIASGMKYLTDHRVVHRDLAARNVLVKNIQHVEITDFGLAKLIDIGSDSVQVGEGKVAIKWLALEALEKQVYNTATDVWAFGVTVWEILTYGESPYANMTPMAIKDFLLCGQRLAQPNNCSTELYKILIDCWLPNPESRPTFAVIKDILYRYCRAPYVFVIDHDQNSAIDLDSCSQRGLIEEILQETDFEDPQNYFDSEPNTPGCHNTGDVFNPIGVRRMDSLGSQRYAQDPTTRPKEFGMADDNYLVPNSHAAEMGATMYTPVVVDESGNSSLVESLGYYNEVKPGAEYINDTQAMMNKKSIRNSRDDRLSTMIEEEEDFAMEKESCL